jgi:cytochrome c
MPPWERREYVLENRMKSLYPLAGLAAAFALVSSPVAAAPDEAAAQKLAKASGCTKCHSVDKTKKGPPYKKTAEKMRGKPDAEAKVYEQITTPQKVKLEDGSEDDHGAVKSKDEAEIKNLVQWILAQ